MDQDRRYLESQPKGLRANSEVDCQDESNSGKEVFNFERLEMGVDCMSACYCGDYSAPEFFIQHRSKAKKIHRCYECGSEIQKGESYQADSGKWEGDVMTYKTCHRCMALRDFVQAHIPCFCWGFGNMREDVLNAALEHADEAPGLLFGAYRREILIRRSRSEAEHGVHYRIA